MSDTNAMSQFILLVKGGYEVTSTFTPEEAQQNTAKYRAWAQKLAQQELLVDAFKLKDDGGRLMSIRHQQIVVDGPLAETRETIGGYFIIRATSYEAAIELAKECPIFAEDGSIEVRQIEL
ncbi:MAG TPA: YciI family protein [Phototrophicaceae bacterium]|jgi:hypothetical protein|nr:YciI family protein [Phototrophicaceae bacterium]